MGFIDRAFGIITKPDSAMKDIVSDPRIGEGLLMVGIYMAAMVVYAFVSMTRLNYVGGVQGIDASTVSDMFLIVYVAWAIISGLIGWPVIAGACRIISKLFGGHGAFYPQTMTAIGYTSLPLIVTTILLIVLSFGMPVVTVDLSAPAHVAGNSTGDPIWILKTMVSIAGAIWTAIVMAFAVKNSEKISMSNALATVGSLFIANLAISFGPLVLAIG